MEPVKKLYTDITRAWRQHQLPHSLVKTYPATFLVTSFSLTAFIIIVTDHVLQLLSYIMYWLGVTAGVVFGWIYPASLVAITVSWCLHVFSIDTTRFNAPARYPMVATIIRIFLSILAGQLVLLCILPVVNFFAMPFASAPTLLSTIIFTFGVIGYGVYIVLRSTLHQDRNAGNGGDRVGGDGDNNTCSVCLVNPKTHVIKPCNHYCVCIDCVRELMDCPICITPIDNYERIFST